MINQRSVCRSYYLHLNKTQVLCLEVIPDVNVLKGIVILPETFLEAFVNNFNWNFLRISFQVSS